MCLWAWGEIEKVMGFALRIICLQTWIVSFCNIWKEIIKIYQVKLCLLGGGPRHACATSEYDVPTQWIYIGIKYEQPIGTVEYFILYCSDFSTKKTPKTIEILISCKVTLESTCEFFFGYGVWAHTKLAPVSLAFREGSGAARKKWCLSFSIARNK